MESLKDAILLHEKIAEDDQYLNGLRRIAELIILTFKTGNKLLIAGNGGSAADAQHFAGELVATFMKEKRRGLPAIALTTDTSFMTAWANDFDFASGFARQVEALGKEGDVLFGISTSGNSSNVIQAVQKAKALDMKTIGLLGNDGGKLKREVDLALIIPSIVTARIQEIHILSIHLICEQIVKAYAESDIS